jgi:hypothetical protein
MGDKTVSVLRREQIVAASLVGAVVVLVGFASGLGITRPAAGNQVTAGGAGQPGASGPAPANQTGATGAGGGGGGVSYVGVAEPGGGYSDGGPGDLGGGAADFSATTTDPLPISDDPPTTTTAPPTGMPGASCQPGLAPLAVTGVVDGIAGLAGNLPLGWLLGGSTGTPTTTTTPGLAGIVDGLTTPLLGSCTTTPTIGPTTTPTTGPTVAGASTPGSGS